MIRIHNMNKNFSTSLIALALTTSASAQGDYTVSGEIRNAEGQKVYLYVGMQSDMTTDSATITGGKFEFRGKTERPFNVGTLLVGDANDYRNPKRWELAIEPTTITISADANKPDDAMVKGGAAQDEKNRMDAEMAVFIKPMMAFNEQYYQLDEAGRDSISQLMEPYRKQYAEYSKNYYAQRTSSYYATYFLMLDMGEMKYEDIKAAWERLSPEVRQYGSGAADISAELAVLAKVRPGSPAPDFTSIDINGEQFTLSSLKGKVVIIDFWASWCGPCRKSNPHMRELYAKYHDRGLDFVYVSDDDSNPEKWRKAVADDQLTGDGYHHVLRGLKVDRSGGSMNYDKTNDISDKYAIHFLPTKYLIDRQGNIVCKIGEEEEANLDKLIESLL